MKVVIFSPYATVVPHFETELEIAQRHLDAGDEVQFKSCWGELANCDFNPTGDRERCDECAGRRQAGLSLLEPSADSLPIIEPESTDSNPFNNIVFESVQQLIDFRREGFDIGYACLSSLVSLCRDPEPDLAKYRELLERLLESSWRTFCATRDYLEQSTPDRVYVFNGRFANMRAVFRACQQLEIDCWLHERGCDSQHYEVFKNHLPHDIQAMHRVICKTWESADVDTRAAIGASWYQDRLNRVEKNWHSFVKDQQQGSLPDDWNDKRRNLAIFCSSDDEFVAIGDHWRNAIYNDQLQGIRRITEAMRRQQPETRIYVRLHPNLRNVNSARLDAIQRLQDSNLSIISPDARVDTYRLMQSADLVASFGSSVGIEAVYWGRPSVLLGPCLYQGLVGPYRAEYHEDAIQLLCKRLPPKSTVGALMYGYWFQTRGRPFLDFQADGFFDGKFKGQLIYAGMEKDRRRPRLIKRIGREASRLLRSLHPSN